MAIAHLTSQDIDYGPIPDGLQGLSCLLFFIARDDRFQVNYNIDNFNYLNGIVIREPSPFANREAFEAWEVSKLDLLPGFHFATPSADIRSCTVSAIDAILRLAPAESAKRKTPAPVRDKSSEDRDRWIYEKCLEGMPHGNIVLKLKANKEGWQHISTPQGIRDRAIKYAKRHGLPEPPPRRS